MKEQIELSRAEVQSGQSRVRWAEGLILQLPIDHEGRNSWLLNYGVGTEAKKLRADDYEDYVSENLVPRILKWDERTECLESCRLVDSSRPSVNSDLR